MSSISRNNWNPNVFSINDVPRHEEGRRVFKVNGLCRLAAQSVDRSPDDIYQEKRPRIILNNYLILENKVDNRLIMESYLS